MRRYARRLPRDAARKWVWLGYMWFGLASYLLLGAIVVQLAVAFGADRALVAPIAIAVAAAIVLAGRIQVARGPLVRRVRVPLRGLERSYTIAHITDIHIGALIGRREAAVLVLRVNRLKPDLVAITGDIVDGELDELREHIAPLGELAARDGVFAVTGNHEYYWDAPRWLEHLRGLGIRLLHNEHTTIADGAIQLAGVNDGSFDEDLPRALVDRDRDKPVVLLAHRPHVVARARRAGVDLQLSGHTHGGQMLPLGWLARLFDPQISGLGRFGATWLYVGQGTGYWGPPLRIGTCCEIAAITLEPA
jgi:hypothetical protein